MVYVDGAPIYALDNKLDGDVNMQARDDTVCQDQQTVHGKSGDFNGTVISRQSAVVILGLGSVYELQFRLMHEKLGNMERNTELNEVALTPYEPGEQAIGPREIGDLESMLVACASGTGSPMQIQVNVPLKTPNQVLHDIITHKELPDDIQNALVDQQLQFEDEGDDESTAENFKAVTREGDLYPKSVARSGKKGNKAQPKEPQQPTRILPRRHPLQKQDDDQNTDMEYKVG